MGLRQPAHFRSVTPPQSCLTKHEAVKQRRDLLYARWRACGEYEELACPREVRIAEHRCGDIVLVTACMLLANAAGQRRGDPTRGKIGSPRREKTHPPQRAECARGKSLPSGQ